MFYLDRVRSSLQPGGGQRVLEYEDDGVAAEEHLGDEPVIVDRLGLLLTLGELGPHLLDTLEDHVEVSVECLDSAQKLLVIPAVMADYSSESARWERWEE